MTVETQDFASLTIWRGCVSTKPVRVENFHTISMRPGWQGPAKGEGMSRQRHTELPNSRKWRLKIKTAVSILSKTALI